MVNRIQIFNIDALNECDNCVHFSISDIFNEFMCNNDIESHILYPDIEGKVKCPFKEEVNRC